MCASLYVKFGRYPADVVCSSMLEQVRDHFSWARLLHGYLTFQIRWTVGLLYCDHLVWIVLLGVILQDWDSLLLVAEFCLTFKGCSVEDLSLPSLYLGYYTTNSTVSLMFQLFGKLSARVTTSREKIHAVKENLQACKLLLRCRRDELKKLWLEGIEHKHVLQLLEEMWVYNGKIHCVPVHSPTTSFLVEVWRV